MPVTSCLYNALIALKSSIIVVRMPAGMWSGCRLTPRKYCAKARYIPMRTIKASLSRLFKGRLEKYNRKVTGKSSIKTFFTLNNA
jgi:hypothetical protein